MLCMLVIHDIGDMQNNPVAEIECAIYRSRCYWEIDSRSMIDSAAFWYTLLGFGNVVLIIGCLWFVM